MYPNLETEQARHGYTEEYVAEKLGITGQEYRRRIKSGAFYTSEARKLALMYNQTVEDLFLT